MQNLKLKIMVNMNKKCIQINVMPKDLQLKKVEKLNHVSGSYFKQKHADIFSSRLPA